ncbi:MAG: hypothetical protein D6682_01620 [Zetaproteobacteria bacterium]|nr:MAG: hypothetical protein D6682_01620 [Zetaproteobacteria bacterium]
MYAAPDARPEAAGIEVMTMHGAKGLQWDTVILPGLGRGAKRRDAPLLVFTETVVGGDAVPLLAARPPKGGEDAMHGLVRDIERAKEEQEDRRLFYVACTRAERALHLLGHVKEGKPEKGSFMALTLMSPDAFGAIVHEYEAGAASERDEPLQPVERVARPLTASPLPEAKAAAAPEYAWAGVAAAPVGNAVHALLEWLGRMGIEHWRDEDWPELTRRARRALLAEGMSGDLLEDALRRVLRAMRMVLASERGRWVLSGRHEDAHCEWEIVTREAGGMARHVIDRAFVADGVRWIVDYKTASHEGGEQGRFLDEEVRRHRAQLMRYADALARMEPGRPLRAALYFPLMDAWREVGLQEGAASAAAGAGCRDGGSGPALHPDGAQCGQLQKSRSAIAKKSSAARESSAP